jgi:hypothetical protein
MNLMRSKLLFFIPLVLFIDWLLLTILGCIAGVCNAGDKFFCVVYCYFGISLIVVSVMLTFFIIYRKQTKSNLPINE